MSSALLASGCGRSAANAARASAPRAPVPVKIATARQADTPLQIAAIGRVKPYQTVTIKPQVAGRITAVHFTEGQTVAADDPLFSLDPRPYEAALRKAEATLARDQALAEDAQIEARWQADLIKQNVAAQREYDKAQADAASLAATVRADEAAVEQARLDLEYCTIRAPLAGRTGSRLSDLGTVVKENETTLVTINQLHPVYVEFAVAEQYVAALLTRQAAAGPLTVEAAVPGTDNPPERGELTFIDNQVDVDTGMLTLKGTFANQHEALWPGQFVNVLLTLQVETGVVLLPSQAVQTGQTGHYVYVVRPDRTVEDRPVVVARTQGDDRVITSGLQSGEVVVTEGQLRLAPGASVIPAEEPAAASTPAPPATTQDARP